MTNTAHKHVFIYTRSKAKALRIAEARGVSHPIAVKAAGGYHCYSAY